MVVDCEGTCANQEWANWLLEWSKEHTYGSSRAYLTYKRAYESLKSHPEKLKSPSEASKLKYIGSTIRKRIQQKIAKKCQEGNLSLDSSLKRNPLTVVNQEKQTDLTSSLDDMNVENPNTQTNEGFLKFDISGITEESYEIDYTKSKKKGESQEGNDSRYIPTYKSAPYAILIALYELKKSCAKMEIIQVASNYTNIPFISSSSAMIYNGWSSMRTLLNKELVYRTGRPPKYSLTEEGEETTIFLLQAKEKFEESLNSLNVYTHKLHQISLLNYSKNPIEICEKESELNIVPKIEGIELQGIQHQDYSIRLIVDERELKCSSERDYYINKLRNTHNILFDFRTLNSGDALWIARDIKSCNEWILDYIVERKRADDLVSSIRDGRFREQQFRLMKSGLCRIIYIIEDNPKYSPDTAAREAIQKALTEMRTSSLFHVHQCSSFSETVDFLAQITTTLIKTYKNKWIYVIPDHLIDFDSFQTLKLTLARNFNSVKFVASFETMMNMLSKKDSLTISDIYLKILMTIKGITASKALKIRNKFPTICDLFAKIQEDNSKVMLHKILNAETIPKNAISKDVCEKIIKLFEIDIIHRAE